MHYKTNMKIATKLSFLILTALMLSMILSACQTTSMPFGQQRQASTEPPSNLLVWRSQQGAQQAETLQNVDLRELFEQRQRELDRQQQAVLGDSYGTDIGFQPDAVDVSLLQDGTLDDYERDLYGQGDRASIEDDRRYGTHQTSINNQFDHQDRLDRVQQQAQEKFMMSHSVKVGILLPLSGAHQQVGQALLNAAQLALVDVGIRNFELVIRDTRGTPEGAQQAANSAISQGASLILGPLFSAEVTAVKPIVRANNMNMIAFSTDWSLADQNTYLIGFMPFAQVARVVSHAASQGYKNLAIIAPHNDYGNAIVETAGQIARRNNIRVTRTSRYRMETQDFNRLIQEFTDYDQRTHALEMARQEFKEIPPEQRSVRQTARLEELKRKRVIGDLPYDMILLAAGGEQAKVISGLLAYYDVDFNKTKLLGTGLFDDPILGREPSLVGAWYAAPPVTLRQKFERDYRDIYGESPLRLASMAYDATALAAILAISGVRERGLPAFDRMSLTNNNGFAGIDGIFRFTPNGVVERGLAVLEIQRDAPRIISPAPESFMMTSN